MRKKLQPLALVAGSVALALAAVSPAAAASFNCAKAGTPTEKRICGNPTVSKLDSELGAAYRKLMQIVDGEDGLTALVKTSQRDWLALRDKCSDTACLADTYQARIAQLDGTSSLQSGDYTMGDVSLFVRDLGSTGRIVLVSGGNARWICDYSGVATPPDGNSAVVGDEKMEVSFAGNTATIEDTAANRAVQQDYCGMNGHLIGDYEKN